MARCCADFVTERPPLRACSTTTHSSRRDCSISTNATFDFRYLEAAIAITEKQRELFEDGAGGFFCLRP